MAITRFIVGDIYGRILAELQPYVDAVTWRINDVGQCAFALPKTDPKAISDYLKFGNRVLLQFDNGLPSWGGVIDPPRVWDLANIQCTAYSGEYIFGQRITDKGRYFSGATVGTIYQALIEEAAAVHDHGIAIGEVWAGGDSHSPDFHYGKLLEIFRDTLCTRLSDADFEVTAAENNGRIVFTANLYERQGSPKNDYALVEGKNVQVSGYSEQGHIVNAWDLAGEGSDWGDTRLTSHLEDGASISTHNLRQDSQIYSDVNVQATLDTHAANLLAQSKDPHNMLELVALDDAPARFADYAVGDSLPLQIHSMGFSGSGTSPGTGLETTVRIWGRSYAPNINLCGLVVREEA